MRDGERYIVPPTVHRIPPYDPRTFAHYWVVAVMHHIDRDSVGPDELARLDLDSLVQIDPPACYYCHQPWLRHVEAAPCPGRPD